MPPPPQPQGQVLKSFEGDLGFSNLILSHYTYGPWNSKAKSHRTQNERLGERRPEGEAPNVMHTTGRHSHKKSPSLKGSGTGSLIPKQVIPSLSLVQALIHSTMELTPTSPLGPCSHGWLFGLLSLDSEGCLLASLMKQETPHPDKSCIPSQGFINHSASGLFIKLESPASRLHLLLQLSSKISFSGENGYFRGWALWYQSVLKCFYSPKSQASPPPPPRLQVCLNSEVTTI